MTSPEGPSSEARAVAAEPIEAEPAPSAPAEIRATFPVVGVGASAGGLASFERFFGAMPEGTGMAFVVVAHLDPHRPSILPDLLQRHSKLPVQPAVDGVRVEPDRVYVITPDRSLVLVAGALQLLERVRARGAADLPIDVFFRSLAEERGENAVGVILSGTGVDGTLGLRAIKGAGGLVVAESEESAAYGGMPSSAVGTHLVDYVVAAEEMYETLSRYFAQAATRPSPVSSLPEHSRQDALQKIHFLLRTHTGHDFSLYKSNTVWRRVERRMNLQQVGEPAEYVRYLQESEREVRALFRELLIGVTSFFRDPPAFEALGKAIEPLLEETPNGGSFRVWCAGCSSGEEPYSLAMLLLEGLDEQRHRCKIQVFATDIDERAIAQARAAVYPSSILPDIGEQRFERFFTREEDGHYRATKSLRETVVFARHNVLKDPPFSKLSLISCRNLLIYLAPPLQRRLLALFHYSLLPDGLLFLGSSESVGASNELFLPVERPSSLFRRHSSQATSSADFALGRSVVGAEPEEGPPSVGAGREVERPSTAQLIEMVLRESETPPCIIVGVNRQLVYVHGRTGAFLEPAEGRASLDVVEMARPGLKSYLAKALAEVAASHHEVVRRGLKVHLEGGHRTVDLSVRPMPARGMPHNLTMVTFRESPGGSDEGGDPRAADARQPRRTAEELEEELRFTQDRLQTTIEHLMTTNEELQSANEELQSTNEELETSQEELQSLNEETVTVNAELQGRVGELSEANDDLKNLLDSIQIATIFLDTDLNVRRFTTAATAIIPLTYADLGRPLHHFASNLDEDVDLLSMVRDVLEDLSVREIEAGSRDGRLYLLRVRPYRTSSNVIDGAVVTFEDVTARKRASAALVASERKLRGLIADLQDGALRLGRDGRILESNKALRAMLGRSQEDLNRLRLQDLTAEPADETADSDVQRQLAERGYSKIFNLSFLRRDGSSVPAEVRAYRIDAEEEIGAWWIVRDVRREKEARHGLETARAVAESIVDTVRQPLLVLDQELCVVRANQAFCEVFGTTSEGSGLGDLGGGWNEPALREQLERLQSKGTAVKHSEVELEQSAGCLRRMLLDARPVVSTAGTIGLVLIALADVPEGAE